jgi:adenosylcobinamide-GDP ribazoletransferase
VKLIKRFVLMVQFLTSVPVPVNLNAAVEDYGKGLVFAPLIGLMMGAVMAGCLYILNLVFPMQVSAVFIVLMYILLTGGLHLDGLGDTFDGVFSNRSREKILEIMRDSRVGTNAVLAIACVLILDAALISNMDRSLIYTAVMLFPAAGRIGSLVGSGVSTYARSGEGLGKSFIDCCGWKEIAAGLAVSYALFYLTAGLKGLVLCTAAAAAAFLLTKAFSSKIGGATGDVLGAVCELNQTLFLTLLYLIRI